MCIAVGGDKAVINYYRRRYTTSTLAHANLFLLDIKPENILYTAAKPEASGQAAKPAEARIADFGLSARIEDTVGQVGGTQLYWAPETCTREEWAGVTYYLALALFLTYCPDTLASI